jgi:hypothetical protein
LEMSRLDLLVPRLSPLLFENMNPVHLLGTLLQQVY